MKSEVTYLSDDHVAKVTAYLFEKPMPSEQGGTPPRRPAILIAPGGGYTYCSDREVDPVALTFGREGYQAFVLEYHCGEASAYPTPLIEIARACSHIRKHGAEYGIDPNKLAVIGFSAGGHLAALLGSSWQQKSLQEWTGFGAEEMRPNAVLLAYPVVNLRPLIERVHRHDPNLGPGGAMVRKYTPYADPLTLIGEWTPPTFLFHTLGDKVILPSETIEYVTALMKHNIKCEYHLFSEGEHGFATADSLSWYGLVYPKRVRHWVPIALAWLNELFQYDI